MRARSVSTEDLKSYADFAIAFSMTDLKRKFKISKQLAINYCNELENSDYIKSIGKSQGGKRGSAFKIYKIVT